jgi:succinate dehydrogenase/fumarate reductase-like Fe-S protein
MQAYRWVIDSRDQYTEERLEELTKGLRISKCENIGMCTVTCPKGLNPQAAINELLGMIKERKERASQELL